MGIFWSHVPSKIVPPQSQICALCLGVDDYSREQIRKETEEKLVMEELTQLKCEAYSQLQSLKEGNCVARDTFAPPGKTETIRGCEFDANLF